MNLTESQAEAFLERNYNRMNLSQVENATTEIKHFLNQFREFNFRNETYMTAFEFLKIKSKLEKSLALLVDRHHEILTKRMS